MANINLVQGGETQEPGVIGRGMAISLSVLVLIVLLYGIIIFLSGRISNDISQMELQYSEAYEKLRRGDASEVVDFQNRMDISQKILAEGKNMPEIFSAIEKVMILGVYLDSYSYEDGSITLISFADNYNAAAKQILSFKNSNYFAGVTAGETEMDQEKGKIKFTVILKLK